MHGFRLAQIASRNDNFARVQNQICIGECVPRSGQIVNAVIVPLILAPKLLKIGNLFVAKGDIDALNVCLCAYIFYTPMAVPLSIQSLKNNSNFETSFNLK